MHKEWFARILILILLSAAVITPVIGSHLHSQGILIHARIAESGGWTPENLTIKTGQPLHLRLTSDDVTHSFAIGRFNMSPVDVLPGEVVHITLVFDKPGIYTFYCTRWCSINHWRMRGVIEVTDPSGQQGTPDPVDVPLYVRLGLDIDAPHKSDILPDQMPSAMRGVIYQQNVPVSYLAHDYYLTHSPVDLWHSLRANTALKHLPDQTLWDLVAWIWKNNTTPDEITIGKRLYETNCAACHGEQGKGDGVFSNSLSQPAAPNHASTPTGTMTTQPVDFTDAKHMLAASPAHLQGKIIRGGMGTGMPYWGPIFTDDQTWALIAYLWTFQFKLEEP